MVNASVNVGSATFSPWIPIDPGQNAFGVGFTVALTSGASLTYSVQHTSDNLFVPRNAQSITRATTTVTLTLPNHRLSVGDWVRVDGANQAPGDVFDGTFAVASVVDTNNITYTVANAGGTVGSNLARIFTARVRPHATLVSQTASADGNYAFPCEAIRINVTAYTSGEASLTVNQGRK